MNRQEWEALKVSRHGKSKATEEEKNLYFRRPHWESVNLRIHKNNKKTRKKYI